MITLVWEDSLGESSLGENTLGDNRRGEISFHGGKRGVHTSPQTVRSMRSLVIGLGLLRIIDTSCGSGGGMKTGIWEVHEKYAS